MITVRNVNEALSVVLVFFGQRDAYREIAPRGVPTLELNQMPYVTRYMRPMECVLYSPDRNANPYFHFFEALWVIAGREDVRFMSHLLPRFKDYSDDGKVFHGAYGMRILESDQLFEAIEQLRRDKDTRRAVVSIWQPDKDSGYMGKDMPCNCMWGAYGSNAVQFSFLLNWVAHLVEVEAGTYTQVSNSMHVYPENEPTKTLLRSPISYFDPYKDGIVASKPWVEGLDTIEDWNEDLDAFFDNFDRDKLGTSMDYETSWWANVVYPMWMSFHRYKDNDLAGARAHANLVQSTDWCLGVSQWLERVELKREMKK
jgi:hypothetical protein